MLPDGRSCASSAIGIIPSTMDSSGEDKALDSSSKRFACEKPVDSAAYVGWWIGGLPFYRGRDWCGYSRGGLCFGPFCQLSVGETSITSPSLLPIKGLRGWSIVLKAI